ncbi:DUF456 domain-containing protein [Janibacter sp. GXQ6167]|uniref:DUF456 domain-containing protein n=1 Tax=Janibacter sp. GXQ6167 TaxID=3240791 RepID=UPI003524F109
MIVITEAAASEIDGSTVAQWAAVLLYVVGLIGIVIPILPGLLACLGAVLIWAIATGGTTAWVVFGICAILFLTGVTLQILIPGRRLKADGVGGWTIVLGVLAGVVGFFVIPFVGLPLFFIGAVYLIEYARFRDQSRAWSATKAAIKGFLRSMGIEFVTALTMGLVWLIGALAF